MQILKTIYIGFFCIKTFYRDNVALLKRFLAIAGHICEIGQKKFLFYRIIHNIKSKTLTFQPL